jgi:hypothetical protein
MERITPIQNSGMIGQTVRIIKNWVCGRDAEVPISNKYIEESGKVINAYVWHEHFQYGDAIFYDVLFDDGQILDVHDRAIKVLEKEECKVKRPHYGTGFVSLDRYMDDTQIAPRSSAQFEPEMVEPEMVENYRNLEFLPYEINKPVEEPAPEPTADVDEDFIEELRKLM